MAFDPRGPVPARAVGPVLLFDGACPLCHASVRAVAARDPSGIIRFASLHSRIGRELLRRAGDPTAGTEGVVLVEGPRAWIRSDAVLEVARRLGRPWWLRGPARAVPRGLREAMYEAIARSRHRAIGRLASCPLPPAALRERFLDAEELEVERERASVGAGSPRTWVS